MHDLRRPIALNFVAALATALVLAGCPVHWVADYDPVMDESVAALQTGTNRFFNEQRTKTGSAAGYAANVEFYNNAKAVVATQAMRAAVLERGLGNDYLSELFKRLGQQYDDLELLHKSHSGGGLTPADVDIASQNFDQAFRAVLEYLRALKTNSQPSAA